MRRSANRTMNMRHSTKVSGPGHAVRDSKDAAVAWCVVVASISRASTPKAK
jgi:hypothetical protein